MKKTRKHFELYLNKVYGSSFGWTDVESNFGHFKVKPGALKTAYENHELGSLERKHDPINFDVKFKEWKRQ